MKARGLIVGGTLLAALAAVSSGCVVEVSFDPFGDDFSVSGEWTINGEAPSASVCDGAGIQNVRIVFYDDGSPYFFDQLTFPCSTGAFETGKIFAYGSYTTEWQAVLTDGTVVKGPMLPLVVNAPIEHANLAPADFVVEGPTGFDPRGTDDSLSADWNINGVAADAAGCAAAGIEDIAIVIYAESDTGYTDGVTVASASCANGKYDSRDPGGPGAILADGRYLTSIDALDSTGAVIGSFRSEFVLDTTAATHAMLMTAEFETLTTLKVNFGWDTDPSSTMSDGDCAGAGVATFSYMLTDTATSTNYDTGTDVACADSLTWEDIPAGTYSIYVEGADSSGVKRWMITCTDLVVADGGFEEYNCSVEDTSGG